ncbi:hypothetical protein AXA88_25880 [Salmonella enterica]|nr:hypothetical protein [Salmonella enterica]EAX3609276.1 hypothetical protein [Salmonella enterica]EGW6282820.1 hypothetical protein [Salmonella enterica]EGX3935302.1 hypothetical protein [Salmonella enterica]
MKNLKKIPVKFSQADATPDGINLVRITEAGWSVHVKLVGWKTALRWPDEGHYDRELVDGVLLSAALLDGYANGYTRLTDEQMVTSWRWIVACLFILEQQGKNGVVEIPNDEGGTDLATVYVGKYGALSVYPAAVRVSLAVNVEGVALEKYGREEGLKLAIRMYRDMTDDGEEMSLSAFGRETFTKLHDETVRMIQDGWKPDTPVMH